MCSYMEVRGLGLPGSLRKWRGASWWPLVHTATVHPCLTCCSASATTEWFMRSDLLLSVTSDLWTSWNEPQGEGGKVTEGCLKERLHTSTLWKAKRVIFQCSFIISTMPGHLVGRKTANWWQPWNRQLKKLFFYLQVENVGKGIRKEQFAFLAHGISHCCQRTDGNVMGRELLVTEIIQQHLFSFESK